MRKKTLFLVSHSLASGHLLGAGSFYKEPQLFSTCPDENNNSHTVDLFGSVGIGIELRRPAFVMKVKNVETGSPAIEDLNPEKQGNINRASIKSFNLKNQWLMDSTALIWSGETLMDLNRFQALQITFKPIDGTNNLFVEDGGFSKKNAADWKRSLIVLKHKADRPATDNTKSRHP